MQKNFRKKEKNELDSIKKISARTFISKKDTFYKVIAVLANEKGVVAKKLTHVNNSNNSNTIIKLEDISSIGTSCINNNVFCVGNSVTLNSEGYTIAAISKNGKALLFYGEEEIQFKRINDIFKEIKEGRLLNSYNE